MNVYVPLESPLLPEEAAFLLPYPPLAPPLLPAPPALVPPPLLPSLTILFKASKMSSRWAMLGGGPHSTKSRGEASVAAGPAKARSASSSMSRRGEEPLPPCARFVRGVRAEAVGGPDGREGARCVRGTAAMLEVAATSPESLISAEAVLRGSERRGRAEQSRGHSGVSDGKCTASDERITEQGRRALT